MEEQIRSETLNKVEIKKDFFQRTVRETAHVGACKYTQDL